MTKAKVRAWTFTVPNWTPALANSWSGRHFSARARATGEAADLLGAYAVAAGVPRVCEHYRPMRRVRVELRGWRRGRVPDPDGPLKVLLDGLVRARLLVDDAAAWCRWEPPTVVRSAVRETVVTLEDVG
jgi:hypothetical protein